MAPTRGKAKVIGPDDPISVLANSLSDVASEIAEGMQLSKFDVAVAYANACGHILADSKDMPRDTALERMDRLREVMQGAYDLRNVEGAA